MRAIVAVCALVSAGCIADEASKACRDVVAKEAPKIEQDIWAQCSSYYENVVLPKLQDQIAAAVKQLADEIQKRIEAALETYGCARIQGADGGAAWDCKGTTLCK